MLGRNVSEIDSAGCVGEPAQCERTPNLPGSTSRRAGIDRGSALTVKNVEQRQRGTSGDWRRHGTEVGWLKTGSPAASLRSGGGQRPHGSDEAS